MLYSPEIWFLAKKMAKQLDGCYNRMLDIALNAS